MSIGFFDKGRHSQQCLIICFVSFVFLLMSAGCSTDNKVCDFKMNIFVMERSDAGKVTINGSLQANVQRIQWDWGDGTVEQHRFFPASHTYGKSGRYTVTVTVYDVKDCSDRKSIAVDIK